MGIFDIDSSLKNGNYPTPSQLGREIVRKKFTIFRQGALVLRDREKGHHRKTCAKSELPGNRETADPNCRPA